jgi:hypothetical protein
MFQRLRPRLLELPTDTAVVRFGCEACNQISAYSKSDLPVARILDSSGEVERPVVVQRAFAIDIGCEGMPCDTPIRIYETTSVYYDTGWIKHYLEKNGSPDSTIKCPSGHPAARPVRVYSVKEL